MGGFGSGRKGGRPTAEASLRIDLTWMIRTGRAVPGSLVSGSLHWTCGGEPSGSISYSADMRDANESWLELSYARGTGESRESVLQRISLSWTRPHFGGKRWWMICPYSGYRVGKLYKPAVGDCFASRHAWRLGYNSQRHVSMERPFESLFRLQKKLGGRLGWEAGLGPRPKHMWHRTYQRHCQRYWKLDSLCNQNMISLLSSNCGYVG